MRIDRAFCDGWVAGKDAGKAVESPTWEDVEEMILHLDGQSRTLVTFGNYEEGYYMAIGGGENGVFIAYVSYDDEERIYHLVNQNDGGNDLVELVVGGQRGSFPVKACVTQDMVISAAKRFFQAQTLDPNRKWEE